MYIGDPATTPGCVSAHCMILPRLFFPTQYRSAIFYTDEEQKKIAQAYIAQVDAAKVLKNPIVTQLVPLDKFYTAEGYHQDYSANNKTGYVVAVSDPKVEKLKKLYPGCVRKRK